MFTDLSILRKIRILSFSNQILDKIYKTYPELTLETIPAGTYQGQEFDINTYTEAGPMVCRADLPEELVYQIVKTIYENKEWLTENVHKGIGSWSFDPSVGELCPLHPGAVKFYKEIGLLK